LRQLFNGFVEKIKLHYIGFDKYGGGGNGILACGKFAVLSVSIWSSSLLVASGENIFKLMYLNQKYDINCLYFIS